jgi:membrane fusion protein (multidrug efflux system)
MDDNAYKWPTFWLAWVFMIGLVGAAPSDGQEATPVIVKTVAVDRFVDRVEALGTLRANESVELTATVSETVTNIHFKDSQRVEAESILVEMTNEEEHALLEEELSTVAEAKKQYDRLRQLVQQDVATLSQLDQQRMQYETAKARLRAIESKMQDRLIIAPFAGVVGMRNISVGALIEPGDLITTLDDDSVMKLDFSVPSIHLATLRTGLPVEATSPAFPGRKFKGTVSSISNRIDPTTRAITARAILPNPERLMKPGLLMSVDILKNPRDALVIPEEALIPSGVANHVLVVDRLAEPTVAQRRKVTIGGRRPGEVEILDGLAVGDVVVTHGALRARPGQTVTILAVDKGDEPLAHLLNPSRKGQSE